MTIRIGKKTAAVLLALAVALGAWYVIGSAQAEKNNEEARVRAEKLIAEVQSPEELDRAAGAEWVELVWAGYDPSAASAACQKYTEITPYRLRRAYESEVYMAILRGDLAVTSEYHALNGALDWVRDRCGLGPIT